MSVSSTTSKKIYQCNGSTVVFPITFDIFEKADVKVIRYTIADATEIILTLETDYNIDDDFENVTIVVEDPGDSIFIIAPSSAYKLIVMRELTLTQPIDYVANDDFPAETHERGLDRAIMLIQQMQEQIDRALLLDLAETEGVLPIAQSDRLPSITTGDADGILTVKANETGYEVRALLDEDDMASDSATRAATQQSIKAYADINNKTEKSVLHDDDLVLIEDSEASNARKKVKKSNFDTDILSSIFKEFAGDGSDGAKHIEDDANFSVHDNADKAGFAQYTTLEIDITKTLTIDTGRAIIGVKGTLTLHGTIDADEKGEEGGDLRVDSAGIGYMGVRADGHGDTDVAQQGVDHTSEVVLSSVAQLPQHKLELAISGSGGGGGSAATGHGGQGGGAGNHGGKGADDSPAAAGQNGNATATAKLIVITGGLGDNSKHGYSHFLATLLQYKGAGGGGGGRNASGGTGGAGGKGGGIIYIECATLIFDGVLTADGVNGADGVGGGGSAIGGGSGGGGGGGVIIIRAKSIITNTGTITVTGGSGGGGGESDGGDGAAGFKDIIQVA